MVGDGGTRLFANPNSARVVAGDGYAAMMRGDLDAFGGMRFQRRLQQVIVGRLPRRMALRLIRQAQETA